MISNQFRIAIEETRILLISDDQVFVGNFRKFLEKLDSHLGDLFPFEEKDLKYYDEYRPDLTLVDIERPEKGGIEVIKLLLASRPVSKLVALDRNLDDERLFAMRELGAVGYIGKELDQVYFVDLIKEVLLGLKCYHRIIQEIQILRE